MSAVAMLLNAITLLATSTSSNASIMLNQEAIREQIQISTDEKQNLEVSKAGALSQYGDNISADITNIPAFLSENYPSYAWWKDSENSASTADVSNAIPVKMRSESGYPDTDIEQALKNTGLYEKTSYGGCGPIAALGILDYFGRYLGYHEIIEPPIDAEKRVALATELFTYVRLSFFTQNPDKDTLVLPWDTAQAFYEVIRLNGLKKVIDAKDSWSLLAGDHPQYWEKIVESIDEGIPVTMFTGLDSGSGSFASHYTNVYGYETWSGIDSTTGQKLTKRFVKARLNLSSDGESTYCDADIFNCGQVGVITYPVTYANTESFQASDFADTFVNSSGGGQYFFYSKKEPVTLANGEAIETDRLRTSYIEGQYLVLSPNRSGAGVAYLDMEFPHDVTRLTFDASVWSDFEDIDGETFKVQYYDDGGWVDHIEIDPDDLPVTKAYPESVVVLFPKGVDRVRFYAEHKNPSGDRNRGRIILDDFTVSYN